MLIVRKIILFTILFYFLMGSGLLFAYEISDNTKTGNEDLVRSFVEGNFTYYFGDSNDILQEVKILSLPENGILKLGSEVVAINQEIPKGQLGNLAFHPDANWNGQTGFNWQGSDGSGFTDESATMNIVIQAVNDNPTDPGLFTLPAGGDKFRGGELIRVSWEPATDPDNDVIEYQLYSKGETDVWVLVTGDSQSSFFDFELPMYNRTDFKFRVRASDGKVTTGFVESQEFTIDSQKPTAPEIEIKTENGLEYTPSQWVKENILLNLSGGSDNLTGVIRQYKLDDGEWVTADSAVLSEEGTHVLYYRALDGAGNSSAINNINLSIDKTPPEDFTVLVEAVGKNEIKIKGTTIDSYSGLADTGTYDFYCSLGGWSGKKEENQFTFNELTPNSSYEFQMKVLDKLDHVRTTGLYTGYTLADIPSVIFADISSSVISAHINPGDNPENTYYYVQCAEDESFTNGLKTIIDWSANTNFTVEGLVPETTYYFRAKARNAEGIETSWSSIAVGATKPVEDEEPNESLPDNESGDNESGDNESGDNESDDNESDDINDNNDTNNQDNANENHSDDNNSNDYFEDNSFVEVIGPQGEILRGLKVDVTFNEIGESILNISFISLNLDNITELSPKSIKINMLENTIEQNILIPAAIWEKMRQAGIELVVTNPKITLQLNVPTVLPKVSNEQGEILLKIRESKREVNYNIKEGENFKLITTLPRIIVYDVKNGNTLENFIDKMLIKIPLSINSWNEFSNPRYLNIYRYDEKLNKWIYSKTKLDLENNMLSTLLEEPGSLAVMEYTKDFEDLAGHWAEKEIEYLAAKYLVGGISGKDFAPEQSLTRAELAALLARVFDMKQETTLKEKFADVVADDWYFEDIQAVYQSGIMEGIGQGVFGSNQTVTIEEIGAILIKAVAKMEAVDFSEDIEYLLEDYNIINSDKYLQPTSRAQGAILIKRFIDLTGI